MNDLILKCTVTDTRNGSYKSYSYYFNDVNIIHQIEDILKMYDKGGNNGRF